VAVAQVEIKPMALVEATLYFRLLHQRVVAVAVLADKRQMLVSV
jgi:hypothetical protein